MEIRTPSPIVSVIGLGLIGGSIAAALAKRCTVYGSDVDPETVRFARARGLIRGDAYERLGESDVVIVATPVSAAGAVIEDVFARAGDRVLITDVASVKGAILQGLPDGARYVGGHPMAGHEKGGVREYSPRLFENAVYVLTEAEGHTSEEDFCRMEDLVRLLGAIPVRTGAEEHDRAVSKISHLPHMIAYTLAATALGREGLEERLAAGSFRDMTRVAASDPAFWTGVAFANGRNLTADMRAFEERFAALRQAIEEGNGNAVRAALERGKLLREESERIGLRHTDALFVDLEDRAGSLGEVTALLGAENVNIVNIRILNSREGIGGALRLDFGSDEDCARAAEVLRRRGYSVGR